jgi:hypothetical protein
MILICLDGTDGLGGIHSSVCAITSHLRKDRDG